MDLPSTSTEIVRKGRRSRLDSFRDAFRGLSFLLRTQPNARIHAGAFAAVMTTGAVLGISPVEWALVCLASGMVITAEAINSALEELADEVSVEPRTRIGHAKDLAAGAVLVAAIFAAIVGGIVFLPRLASLCQGVVETAPRAMKNATLTGGM